ncbi:hypothetical protein [Siminovitchia fordii]|uniref:Uncharacterized protein n=1 Tax=Siminovitchia fordii TaxID=254759 RepID=A0ABQ4KBM3_9BACI|nr:hypothetical protein [Siminovitchia fordii]GIN23131.1 hypothetical protein J1TS3_42650 [Siminovitchia fordii]
MNELTYTKEATYQFEYNGDVNYEYHFVDSILNMRFRSAEESVENSLPTSIGIKGTNEAHQIIKAVLVGERVFYEDTQGQKFVELLYLLPDINCYMQIEYRKEYEPLFDKWIVGWSSRLGINLIKPN